VALELPPPPPPAAAEVVDDVELDPQAASTMAATAAHRHEKTARRDMRRL
jgi:hypothetical protein